MHHMAKTWTLEGKTCLITGATQGIGRVTARELAPLGPHLLIVARDKKRGAELVDELKKSSGNPNIELFIADLSIQADVRRLAAEVMAKHKQLHLLLNNAGALFTTRQLTPDGYETTFALNHLGYFLLTDLLLDLLKRTASESGEARIVNVASNAHVRVKNGLDFDDLMSERSYSTFDVYSRSKFANILFTYELARRIQASGVIGAQTEVVDDLLPRDATCSEFAEQRKERVDADFAHGLGVANAAQSSDEAHCWPPVAIVGYTAALAARHCSSASMRCSSSGDAPGVRRLMSRRMICSSSTVTGSIGLAVTSSSLGQGQQDEGEDAGHVRLPSCS